MPRGGPDWETPGYQLSGVQVDIADVADRILGFSRLDTRGRVFLLDTFNDGIIGWSANSLGSGNAPVAKLSQTLGFAGPVVVFFDAGAGAGGGSLLLRSTWLGSVKRIGFEFCLTIGLDAGDIEFLVDYNRVGSARYSGRLKWKQSTAFWQVYTPAGYQNVVDGAAIAANGAIFLQVKWVADFETGKYDRLLLGEIQYDISGYSLQTVGVPAEGWFYTHFDVENVSPTDRYGYLHYVILTKDEQ